MKTPNQEPMDDFLMNESDEYLLKMAEELKDDLSDIKVSEDLIARTLAKVSEQAKKDVSMAEPKAVPINDIKAPVKHKRSYEWIKPLSVAVAACFILFLGVNVAKNGLIGSKNSYDSSPYEKKTASAPEYTTAEADENYTYESAEVADSSMELPSATKSDTQESNAFTVGQDNNTMVDITATEGADIQGDEGKVTGSATGAEVATFDIAVSKVTNEASDPNRIYLFEQDRKDNVSVALLTLLTSEELNTTIEEAIDEWQYYLVFSLGEEDAVTYRIGKSKFVIATKYHGEEESSQIIYQMKDADSFIEKITEYLE